MRPRRPRVAQAPCEWTEGVGYQTGRLFQLIRALSFTEHTHNTRSAALQLLASPHGLFLWVGGHLTTAGYMPVNTNNTRSQI
jgi:hypothetical protein